MYKRQDLCFVEDIARANLLAATTDKLDGLPVNVGSGRATSVRDLAAVSYTHLPEPAQDLLDAAWRRRPGQWAGGV